MLDGSIQVRYSIPGTLSLFPLLENRRTLSVRCIPRGRSKNEGQAVLFLGYSWSIALGEEEIEF